MGFLFFVRTSRPCAVPWQDINRNLCSQLKADFEQMGLETPQGREIFTKGIVVVSPALSAPSAAPGAGTEPSDPRRVFPLSCCSLGLAQGRHRPAPASSTGSPGHGSTTLCCSQSLPPAWHCCSAWKGKGSAIFLPFLFSFSFSERNLCCH